MHNLRTTSVAVLILALTAGAGSAQTGGQEEPSPDLQQSDPTGQPTQSNGLDHTDEAGRRPGAGGETQLEAGEAGEAAGGNGESASADGGECQIVQQDPEQSLSNDPERRAQMGAGVIRDLRNMRDAATSLQRYGQTEACRQVTKAMQAIMEDPRANTQTGTDETAATQQGSDADPASLNPEERWSDQREEAVAMDNMDGAMRAEEIIGTDVRDGNNDNVGEVDDIVISGGDGQSYLIVAYGGMLGLGEDRTAVPLSAAAISKSRDVIFLPMTLDELEQAPSFEEGNYDWLGDESWIQQNEEFYSGG